MSAFSDDLLLAAAELHTRKRGQKGSLKAAFTRRSISTIYYAIFHFVLNEVATRIVGSGATLRLRRRVFMRTLSHAGLTTAFAKLRGAKIDRSIEDLFRLQGASAGPVATPIFIRRLATAFLDARTKREDADYNLDEPFGETDARQLHARVITAIAGWETAATPADRDAKHAVAILVSLKGRLRDQ